MGLLKGMASAGLYSSDPPYYTYGAPQVPLQPAMPPQETALAQQQPAQRFAKGGRSLGRDLAELRQVALGTPRPKQSLESARAESDKEFSRNTAGYENLPDRDMQSAMGTRRRMLTGRDRIRVGDRPKFAEGGATNDRAAALKMLKEQAAQLQGGQDLQAETAPEGSSSRMQGEPMFVEGPGTGRSDSIPAELSDGEYVFDAETVALLGDGSSKAGAEKLDALRASIRSHKGAELAKGKISPDAKPAEMYMGGKV